MNEKKYEFPLDLLIILIWTILTMISVLVPFLSETFIRVILGIPVFIFIPGYLLIAILFPESDQLEGTERISMSFGLSIASVTLIGLLFNFTFTINPILILLTLCLFSLASIIIAIYRLNEVPLERRFSVPINNLYNNIIKELRESKVKLDMILAIILIFSILLGIVMTIYIITTPKTGDKFTEFYILGPNGKADNYPSQLIIGSPANVTTGVVNHEYSRINYTLEVALDKEVLNQTRLSLDHNETWENYITFVPNKGGTKMKLELWLFKDDNFTSPYRDLHTWVNVK